MESSSIRDGMFWRLLACFVCATQCLMPSAVSVAADYSEVELKAAYLYRFPGYIEWPSESKFDTFTIAVLGANDVANALEKLLAEQPIKGHPARVRQVNSSADIGDAQVLYIGPSHPPLVLKRIIANLAARPLLIVSDDARGIDLGSQINFVHVDRKIRFEVSVPAMKQAGLNVSSELLSVAAKVHAGLIPNEECANGESVNCRKAVAMR